MSEWAYWRGMNASSGWSARGGQCRNPYALDRTPCGSSSGSGSAASANLAARHHRHRDGRVDHLPVFDQRHRRTQTDGGPVEPRRHHPDLALTGLRGTDDPHGARRRHPPRRRLWRGPARSRHVGERRPLSRRLHDVSGSRRAEGRAARHRPEHFGLRRARHDALRSRHRRPDGGWRGDRRSREPAEHGLGQRVPGTADDGAQLRVQGEHQPLLREPGADCAGEEPGGADPLQRYAPRSGDAVLRSGAPGHLGSHQLARRARVPQGGRDHSAPDPCRGHRCA